MAELPCPMKEYACPTIGTLPSCRVLHEILTEDQLQMRCFPYTLKNVAKTWFMSLTPTSLTTWDAVYNKFIGKFYSHAKTTEFRGKIATFSQMEGDAMGEKTTQEMNELYEMLGANSQQKSVTGEDKVNEKQLSVSIQNEEINPIVAPPKAYAPPIPFSSRLKNNKWDKSFSEIYDILSKVNVNLPLLYVMRNIPAYAKFLKDLITCKHKFEPNEKVMVPEKVSVVLQRNFPPKLKDLGSFIVNFTMGDEKEERAMLDLGASINLMHYSTYLRLGFWELKPTTMSLQLANNSIKYPRGIVENVLVKVDKLIITVDFVVLDMEKPSTHDGDFPILLGRPFMAITKTVIDVQNGKLSMIALDELWSS
ncbi:uncharacterized protein LOC116118979 [Pistacia vera]|uniref:uncharacterized protein LOC116118979 n=1 Tax=Pistacia vera TaxID=55513 RepID=UPI001263C3B8|nr:uncharacterized protein LOC116118979 [Pistacia vera]